MGYESRIFFVERKTCFNDRVVIGSEISRFDLSKMGYYEYKWRSKWKKINGAKFVSFIMVINWWFNSPVFYLYIWYIFKNEKVWLKI